MGVGYHNVADFGALHRSQNSLHMGSVSWTRIDHGYLVAPYQIGAGALEGEFAGVVGSDAPDQR